MLIAASVESVRFLRRSIEENSDAEQKRFFEEGRLLSSRRRDI